MKNIGSYLAMEEFHEYDSAESILSKIKDMFEVDRNFINIDDEEEYTCEGEDGTIYNSQLEEIFYENFKENMSLTELRDLIDEIGNTLIDLKDDEYGDFNIVSIKQADTITIAISLSIYFI